MKRREYFTRDGRRIPEHEAVDACGILRDGVAVRVRLTMRDHRSVDADSGPMRVTDAAGRGGAALHRPGYRCLLDDAAGLHAKATAYRRADAEMVKAWRKAPTDVGSSRVCPECDGSGLDENDEDDCPACRGMGAVDADYVIKAEEAARNTETHHEGLSHPRSDSRSVNQIMRDHQANMARIYANHARELTEAWRRS